MPSRSAAPDSLPTGPRPDGARSLSASRAASIRLVSRSASIRCVSRCILSAAPASPVIRLLHTHRPVAAGSTARAEPACRAVRRRDPRADGVAAVRTDFLLQPNLRGSQTTLFGQPTAGRLEPPHCSGAFIFWSPERKDASKCGDALNPRSIHPILIDACGRAACARATTM